MTEHLVWLNDAACHRTDVAGGKGASLGRILSAGMPVPAGFVVTAGAFADSLKQRGVLDEVRDLTASFGAATDGALLADSIQRIVLDSPPADELAEHIRAAYAGLGENAFVAVRSSACAEDGEAASFAGQQETFLNVVGTDAVLVGIVKCWASFFSERALFYRKSKGSLADLGMAVVVQLQISADKSGVMFTSDPIRRRNDQMVIEAVFGLGEALVSGLVTPDHYITRLDGTVKKARAGHKDRMIVRQNGGGTSTVDLDDDMAAAEVLTGEEIVRLVNLGRRLEDAFAVPQDVEWSFQADELFILQSRPITA